MSKISNTDIDIDTPHTAHEKTTFGEEFPTQHQHQQHKPSSLVYMAGPDASSLHPGLWRPYEHRKFANPAPLGLSAFALTTFVLSCVNLRTRGVTAPNIAVPLAFGYGGLVQLLAGMWWVLSWLS